MGTYLKAPYAFMAVVMEVAEVAVVMTAMIVFTFVLFKSATVLTFSE